MGGFTGFSFMRSSSRICTTISGNSPTLIQYNKLDYYPRTWIIYVDDIFIIQQQADTLINGILKQINMLDSKIKFELEIEQSDTLFV